MSILEAAKLASTFLHKIKGPGVKHVLKDLDASIRTEELRLKQQGRTEGQARMERAFPTERPY